MTGEPSAVAVVRDAQVVDFVQSARSRLIVVAPAVAEAVATAIRERASVIPWGGVTVILDTDPEVYRLGYGDPGALLLLEEAALNQGVNLRRQPGLRLCILIADARTLIYAPTPRLIEAGPNTQGAANAIYLGAPPAILERELDPVEGRPKVGAEPMSASDVEHVRQGLDKNPPQKFDIARRMRVFNAYYEFVEFELTGVHVDRKQVRIPEHLLGLADETTRARLRSHFQLVPSDSEMSGEALRRQRDLIGQQFLVSIRRFGTVVRRTDKEKLEKAVEGLRETIVAFKESLAQELQASIDQSRAQLVDALLPGLCKNPPKGWRMGGAGNEETLRRFVDQDLRRAFGTANRLLSGMEVTLRYKGLTYETLVDKEFLAAAEKAGLDLARLHEEFNAAKATPAQVDLTPALFPDTDDE